MKEQNFENNEKIKLNFEKNKYYIHEYILLGLLLSVVIFVKYKKKILIMPLSSIKNDNFKYLKEKIE